MYVQVVTDLFSLVVFFFQAEDGIRDLVRSRGLGDVYKRQAWTLQIGRRLDFTQQIVCGFALSLSLWTALLALLLSLIHI